MGLKSGELPFMVVSDVDLLSQPLYRGSYIIYEREQVTGSGFADTKVASLIPQRTRGYQRLKPNWRRGDQSI